MLILNNKILWLALADGQNIYTWRYHRLYERAPRENQQVARRRNRSGLGSNQPNGHLQGAKAKWSTSEKFSQGMVSALLDICPVRVLNQCTYLNNPESLVEFSGMVVWQFDVERRNMDTRIEICCAAKPGLLLSTVNTLELLGLEIQQCVISCFNDFSMQASCSDVCMLIRFLHFIFTLHALNHLIRLLSLFVLHGMYLGSGAAGRD